MESTYIIPGYLSSPGDTLSEKLEEIGMTQKEFATRTGKPEKTISAIINGESGITPETALKFESVLNIPAKFWLKREAEYQEAKARIIEEETLLKSYNWAKEFPLNILYKHGWLEKKNEKPEIVKQVFSYFSVASVEQWNEIYMKGKAQVSYRISLMHAKEPKSLAVWLKRGEIQAREIETKPYNESGFKKALKDINELAYNFPPTYREDLQRICAEVGVKVVYTPCIPKAPISGAARWVGENPLIQLSGRGKQHDKLWFTFFHEAGHIILHGKKTSFLEGVEGFEVDKVLEDEANDFATGQLIPIKEFEKFVSSGLRNIESFASKHKIRPGIIVGRLQYLGHIDYSVGREFIEQIDLFAETDFNKC